MYKNRIVVLLAEDNPADADLTVAALRDAKIANEVHIMEDGEAAISFLKRSGKYAKAPRPDLVLLDLSLPKLDGYQVLEAMKGDLSLRGIPVVVVSSSARESDISRAYDQQIAAYLVKPIQLDEYFLAIRSIKELWFRLVALPPKKGAVSRSH